MLVLITYDVNTESKLGQKRLRRVAKVCVDYGQRVQNSVFECSLDSVQLCLVRNKLLDIINTETDSIRIYKLGNNYESKIEHYGAKAAYLPNDVMVF